MQQWVDLQVDEARASAERAMTVLEPVGDRVEHASALIFLAVLLIVMDRDRDRELEGEGEGEGEAKAEAGLAMCERMGAHHLRPLGLLY